MARERDAPPGLGAPPGLDVEPGLDVALRPVGRVLDEVLRHEAPGQGEPLHAVREPDEALPRAVPELAEALRRAAGARGVAASLGVVVAWARCGWARCGWAGRLAA